MIWFCIVCRVLLTASYFLCLSRIILVCCFGCRDLVLFCKIVNVIWFLMTICRFVGFWHQNHSQNSILVESKVNYNLKSWKVSLKNFMKITLNLRNQWFLILIHFSHTFWLYKVSLCYLVLNLDGQFQIYADILYH